MTKRMERMARVRPPDVDPLAAMLRQALDRTTDPAVRTWLAAMREHSEGGAVKPAGVGTPARERGNNGEVSRN